MWNGNSFTDYKGELFYIIPGTSRAFDLNPQYPPTDSDDDGIPDWY
ncbi:MAG: hypothetical protein ACW967_04330 [Candidatus Hodarchaeales archaeon]